MFEGMRAKGAHFLDTIPCKTRSRSVPDVVDTKFAVSLLAKPLIKCQRLPRVFQGIVSRKRYFTVGGVVTLKQSN